MFRDKDWVLSPGAFVLDDATKDIIAALGPALRSFQQACNTLYFRGLEVAELAWVPRLLDLGKPERVVQLGRQERWRADLPSVLRPDLVLTEEGVCISELDSLPGGIGLTGWLNETYAAMGDDVIGGAYGMLDGFAAAFPHEDVLISKESSDYQPEMEWLVQRLNERSGGYARSVMNPWNPNFHAIQGRFLFLFF